MRKTCARKTRANEGTASLREVRKALKIAGRVVVGLCIAVYIVVALCLGWRVQTLAGNLASNYFSKELGGTARVSTIAVNPLGRVSLGGIQLVHPEGDTIFRCRRLDVRFHGMPVVDDGLKLDRVSINNAYFHFETVDTGGINLKYIFNYVKAHKMPDTTHKEHGPFIVRVKRVNLNGVEYRMDLNRGNQKPIPEHSVSYKHQHYYDIHASFKDVRVQSYNVDCRIVRFATRERSGFELKDMSCDAHVSSHGISARNMELITQGTHLLFDAQLDFDTWSDLGPYCDSVRHSLTLREGSVADMRDVGYWVPIMHGVRDRVFIHGHAEGPVADLNVEGLDIDIDNHLSLHLSGTATGLPHIGETRFHAKVANLRTSYDDLCQIALPERATFALPKNLKPLDQISGNLTLDGHPGECDANVELRTGAGNLNADVAVRQDNQQLYNAVAHVASPSLRVGSLLPNEWVSASGLRATISLNGNSYRTLAAHAEGELYSTVLRGTPIQATSFEASYDQGHIELDADIDDPLLALSLSASVEPAEQGKNINIDAVVDHCALSQLHLLNSDSLVDITTHLRLDATGNAIQTLSGNAALSKTTITYGTRQVYLNNVLLSLHETDNRKTISLTSDWLNLNAKGYLDYADIPLIAQDFCHRYFPAYFNPWKNSRHKELLTDANLTFDLLWKGDYTLLHTLGTNISVSRGTLLSGTYSATDQMRLVLRADSLAFGPVQLCDIGLTGRNRGDSYALQLQADRLNLGAPSILEGVKLQVAAANYETTLKLSSGNRGNMKNALLDIVLLSDTAGNRLHLMDGGFEVARNRWQMNCQEDILLGRGRYEIPLLLATDGSQALNASLHIDGGADDELKLTFRDFSLAWIANQWLYNTGFDVEGRLDGEATLRGIGSTPSLAASLDIDGCHVNNYMLGKVALRSASLENGGGLKVDVQTQTFRESGVFSPLTASGIIDLAGPSPTIDASCDFDRFPLVMVTPLLSSFASRFEGMLHGNLHIGGTLRAPRIVGDAVVDQGLLSLVSTGVTYRFDDTIHMEDRRITLDDFRVVDPRQNLLTIDGHILYNSLDDATLDLRVASSNFMLLNLPERSDKFSGTIMASLGGTVSGSTRNLHINVAARTTRGSTLSVPVDDRKKVSESNFITFATHTDSRTPAAATTPAAASHNPVTLTANLEITPDLQLRLPMTFQQIAPTVTTAGNGNLLVSLSGDGTPTVTGGYELTSGNLNLELFSFLSTAFTIDQGSTIVFPGDINNASFNIKASHLVHANLASLMGTTVESSARTVNVEDVIALSGTLAEPSISFDLRFPSADKSVEDEVSVYIDRSNEREVFSQAMSLLLTGQFSNTTSTTSSLADNASASGYNMMASTLGSMVSNVVKVVDVNFGYQGETALTTEQFDIDIRKEWDRLYFETTFGYGGETRALQTDEASTTNLVGDVLVGYKINPRLHLFVFNRTNTNDFTRAELPYKQGVGLKLTRDFDRWTDLLKKKTTPTVSQ